MLAIVTGFLYLQLDYVKEQNSDFEADISDYQSQIGQLEDQILDLESQLGVLQGLNGDLKSQNSDLENDISDYQSQIGQLEDQILNLESQLDELQNLNIELEKKIDEYTNRVRITKFSVSGFNPIVGGLIYSDVIVIIQNFGINDVEGLVLEIKDSNAEEYANSIELDILRSGETRTINTYVAWNLGYGYGNRTATLKLNDQVLDWYVIYSW